MGRALLVVDIRGEYDGGALPIAHPPLGHVPARRPPRGGRRHRAGHPLVIVDAAPTGLLPSAAAALEAATAR